MAITRHVTIPQAVQLHTVPECMDCASVILSPGSMHADDGGHVWSWSIGGICKASGTKIV